MQQTLDIITITKDDLEGVAATILSTRKLRACPGVRQIIIDGSSETVQKKVRELLVGEEQLEYHWQEPKGIANAFNLGITASDSEWVWFLNGRDKVHPDLDEHFILEVLAKSQAGMLICDLQFMQSGLGYKRPPLCQLWPPLYWVPHPATLMRRKLFNDYGVFSDKFKIAMDCDLWVRLFIEEIQVDMLSMTISVYDQNGVSSTDSANVVREVERIILNYFSLLLGMWFRDGMVLFRALIRRICAR